MALFEGVEQRHAVALSELSYCNPFLPERIGHERVVLGDTFVDTDSAWHKHADEEVDRPNIDLLTRRAKELADAARERLMSGESTDDAAHDLYEDTVLYYLFNRYQPTLFKYIRNVVAGNTVPGAEVPFYEDFQADMVHYFALPGTTFSLDDADHIFACFFQIRRAFHHIYDNIIGGSLVSARLRAAVWQSVFTCDMRRYRRTLYARMGDITTLVAGPSGTGKELVACAIGFSRYIPFDAKHRKFATDFTECFLPINLSALSPTLIESELFGHTKGSFTGAVADRAGFLETCPAEGAVFLDEIGELDPAIQVKLLRVLQNRVFQRIGDTTPRRFEGKIVAATNRDPVEEMQERRFRQDLYYRLCSDVIVTPSLREQLQDAPEQLHNLLLFIARRVIGPEEAESLVEEVGRWIGEHLGPDYPWPGNVRELEQCVRNILIRREYQPLRARSQDGREAFLAEVDRGALSVEELLRGYCTLVYAQTGSYQETGRRLVLDRRTVKSRIDDDLLHQLRPE